MSDTTRTDHAVAIYKAAETVNRDLRPSATTAPTKAAKALDSILDHADALAAERDALLAYALALESSIRRVSELSAQSGFPIVLHTRLIDDARRDAGVAELMARDDR